MSSNKRNLMIVVALLVVVFAIAGLVVLNADDDDSSLAGTAGGDKNKTEEPKDGQNDLTGDMPAFNADALLAEFDLDINVDAFCSEVDPPSTDYEYGFVIVNKGRDMAEELAFAVTTNRSLDEEDDPNSMSLDRPGMTGGEVERSVLHEGTFQLAAGESFEFIPEETETFSDMELNRTLYFEIEDIDAYEVQCLPEDQANAAATATAAAEENE